MTKEECIASLEETVAKYEKMKAQYSADLDKVEARIDYLLNEEHMMPSSPRVRALMDIQMSSTAGLRGVCDYLNVITERLEDAKNDPNYDHETWRSSKAKKNC